MKKMVVAAFALVSSATAVAGDFKFNYSAEDLATPAEIQSLHARLERAAGEFCQRQYDRRLSAARMCQSIIVQDAVRQIDSPQLTARLEGEVQPTT